MWSCSNRGRRVLPTCVIGCFRSHAAADTLRARPVLVATWAWREIGFPRVQLMASPHNGASQRVATRAGFKTEVRLRKYGVEPDGTRVDAVFYSLVTEDLSDPEGEKQ